MQDWDTLSQSDEVYIHNAPHPHTAHLELDDNLACAWIARYKYQSRVAHATAWASRLQTADYYYYYYYYFLRNPVEPGWW